MGESPAGEVVRVSGGYDSDMSFADKKPFARTSPE
jgi:hypothetical protein